MKASNRFTAIGPLVLIAASICVGPSSAGEWTDPTEDVRSANADIVSGSATVSGGT